MKLTAYYNEIDPKCCAWLSNLMDIGAITPGKIDNRSIEDVTPDDVKGFIRVGFFAGIGGWDYALRLAGWPEDRPVWHGSPPCQPFSNAGKQKAQADARHLWPVFFDLIRECKPANIFGEQVEAAIRTGWLDDLQDDLEAEGYATGKIVLPACGIGGFHIRQRIWFVAERVADTGLQRSQERQEQATGDKQCGEISRLADSESSECQFTGRTRPRRKGLADNDSNSGLAESDSARRESGEWHNQTAGHGHTTTAKGSDDRPKPADAPESIWRNPDWLFCRDGKWRPVESSLLGIFNGLPDELVRSCNISRACYPLAKEQEARVMRLRGYGNAIVPAVAAEVIKAYMETTL